MSPLSRALALTAVVATAAAADSPFKLSTRDEIIASSRTLAADLVSSYKGNETGKIPGLISEPPPLGDYYWDTSAHYWATLIDYWKATGDESYNPIIAQGLQFQRGPHDDYMPPNFTATLGNFDQCGWAMAAVSAAEKKFPDPPSGGVPWLKLAENVLDTQVSRWESETGVNGTCGGGLRWQILPFNVGYDYKETVSNGCYFTLAARLARLTGNSSYVAIANDAYNWLAKTGLLDTATYSVFDGAHTGKNCTDINKAQFSNSASLITLGAAYMYNITSASPTPDAPWKDRLANLTAATLATFFPKGIAYEPSCEAKQGVCNTDQVTLKGYTHRWLAATAQIAPFTGEKIMPVLKTSAEAAVKQCTGGDSGRACGFYWTDGVYVKPTTAGVGEQMNVLAAVESLLLGESGASGGSSAGGSGNGSGNGNGGSAGNPKSSMAARREVGGLMAGVVMIWMYLLL